MLLELKARKQREVSPREVCPESGARVVQLTSAAYLHAHIYPESPVFTPDSRYFIYQRFQGLDGPNEYWLCDLATYEIAPLTEPGMLHSPAVTPDGRHVVYLREVAPRELEIRRITLATRTDEPVARVTGHRRPYPLSTISSDSRWFVTGVWAATGLFGLLRVDLATGEAAVVHEGQDIFNPHMQFDPRPGKSDILVQHNRGGKVDENGHIVCLIGDIGATFYLIDKDGGNLRRLAIGKPYTVGVQGHQCWLGLTGRILSTLGTSQEDAERVGNICTIAEGDARPTIIAKGHYFSHPNASRDGRFLVSDALPGGDIYVGSVKTGRILLLCRSLSSFGTPQYAHPHPAFSPDAKTVLFNSDRTGLAQIFCARLPEGLLESLER